MFRKLARELVIFMFVFGFIGAAWAATYTAETTPTPKVVITPSVLSAVPDAHGYTVEPPQFDPAKPYATLPPCPPEIDAWTVYRQHQPCMLSPEQQASINMQNAEIYQRSLQSRREAIGFAGIFGFAVGLGAGIVAWIFYRGARFAITG